MMRIVHPRPQLGRQKFIGVEFIDGVAEVESLHPEVQASLLQHGFTIQDLRPAKKATTKALKDLAAHIVPLTPDEE